VINRFIGIGYESVCIFDFVVYRCEGLPFLVLELLSLPPEEDLERSLFTLALSIEEALSSSSAVLRLEFLPLPLPLPLPRPLPRPPLWVSVRLLLRLLLRELAAGVRSVEALAAGFRLLLLLLLLLLVLLLPLLLLLLGPLLDFFEAPVAGWPLPAFFAGPCCVRVLLTAWFTF
jgi:hypothetical protein